MSAPQPPTGYRLLTEEEQRKPLKSKPLIQTMNGWTESEYGAGDLLPLVYANRNVYAIRADHVIEQTVEFTATVSKDAPPELLQALGEMAIAVKKGATRSPEPVETAPEPEAPWMHCNDCDPSFTCWNSGSDCRKRARTVKAPAPEAKDDDDFPDIRRPGEVAGEKRIANQAARIAELERDLQAAKERDAYRENLVTELRNDRADLRDQVAQLTKERDEARAKLEKMKRVSAICEKINDEQTEIEAAVSATFSEALAYDLLETEKAENATLRARVAELEKDRERLDHCQKHGVPLMYRTTLRAAIDDDMKEKGGAA